MKKNLTNGHDAAGNGKAEGAGDGPQDQDPDIQQSEQEEEDARPKNGAQGFLPGYF